MKKAAYAAAAASLAWAAAWATPSAAQDGVSLAPWSGFYVGGHVGWAGDTSDLSFRDFSAPQDLTFRDRSGGNNNFLAGADVGYNWWMGNMLGGVEGDASWPNHGDYLASIRGRLGFAPSERWMLYGTAGVGFMNDKEHFTVDSASDGIDSFSRSKNRTGFVGGVGTEFALAHNLGLGVEGLWYDFGRDHTNLTTASGEDFGVHDNRNFGVVRARLTWYLNQ